MAFFPSRTLAFALAVAFAQGACACSVPFDTLAARPAPDPMREADAVAVLQVLNMRKLAPEAARDGAAARIDVPSFALAVKVHAWKKNPGVDIKVVRDSYGTNCDPVFGITRLATASPAELFGKRWLVYLARSDGHYHVSTAVPVQGN